ncbi:MAG: UTP--glucose-1-phosphate uridylyltransferase [Bacteriovoracales bacterium]|nr:UTP--glucose-1-phosphate uridylyltransferase [Bacteriovoracales bacterium]
MTKAIIPIAGKGSRFLPATKQVPKELIPLLNVPMLHYVVLEAVESGVDQIVFVTSSGKQEIENFYDRNLELEEFLASRGKTKELELVRKMGSMVDVIAVRQKEPLGLGHAVLCARPLIEKGEDFVVLLGDDLAVCEKRPIIGQLMDVSKKYNGACVIGVMEVEREETHRYGIVEGKEIAERTYEMSGMVEKPSAEKAPTNLAVPGRYVLPYEIFDILQGIDRGVGGEFQLTDGIDKLCREGRKKVLAYRFLGERFDTGNLRGYLNATLEFALRDDDLRDYTIDLMKDKMERYGG